MVLSDKAKQYLLVALKLIILVGMALFLYQKLWVDNGENLGQMWRFIKSELPLFLIPIWFILSLLNWALEARKWQLLTATTQPVSYTLAWRQSYASLAASLLTPQRVGEYGAKALFFPPDKRKRILWLTFVGNFAQLTVTTVVGIPALIWMAISFDLPISTLNLILLFVVLLLLICFAYLIRKRQLLFQGLSLSALWKKTASLPKEILWWVTIHSVLRYSIFSGLFVWMLIGFGAENDPSLLYGVCFAYYLLSSVTPMLFVLDVVVKSGIAIALFSLAGVPELISLSAVLLGWILNFGIPAIIGSTIIANHKKAMA